MGFKIRDKSLFWTRSGWKNNWEAKILNMPRPVNSGSTMYVTCNYDHHSFLRMVQSYRNYSRTLKQYLHGNTEAEQAIILELRTHFLRPFTCETPVELIKHGAEKRMADQLDRDYELLSHNYHPYQLYTYDLVNKSIRDQNEEAQTHEKGEQSFFDVFEEEFKQEVAQAEKTMPSGEKLSLQKIGEIFTRISRQAREAQGQTLPKGEDGEFKDFLEKRRPFLNPNTESVGH